MNRVDNRVAGAPDEPVNVFPFDNKPLTGLAGLTGAFPFPRLAGRGAQREGQSRRFCLRALYPVNPVKSVKYKRYIEKVITGLNRLNRVRASLVPLGGWRAPPPALCVAIKGG